MATEKERYVKVTAQTKDAEWYAIDHSKASAKSLADEMGMPARGRRYEEVFMTREQFEKIPEWAG